jgi:UDP-N-acetylmuramoyl-tripeptide--D-alanyl-D-alanine ligase
MNVPTPAEFWTPTGIAAATGGQWLTPPRDPRARVVGLGTDTRTLAPGQAYLAIRGDRFDGHDFVARAFDGGAAMAIVEDNCDTTAAGAGGTERCILGVPDTVAAMQAMARLWRGVLGRGGCRVVAVTGSNGKTTTRHLIHAVLSKTLSGTQSPRSFNNHLGVPLTLLAAQADHGFVAVEIGSNHPGEVAALAAIARPDAAVVTGVGHEHMAFFRTLANVAAEEFSVVRFVASGGLIVAPAEAHLGGEGEVVAIAEAMLEEARRAASLRLVRFGDDPAVPDDFPLPGEHNRRNAAAAAAVGRWFGVGDDDIAAALAAATPVEGRMQRLDLAGVTVYHDAYNANPSSMAEALRTFAHLPTHGRRVAILGDMFELGDEAPDLHRRTADIIAELPAGAIRVAVTIGRLSMFTAEALARRCPGLPVHGFAQWSDDVPTRVAELLEPGDTVLLKASRGMKLERLVPAIENRSTTAAAPPDAPPRPTQSTCST